MKIDDDDIIRLFLSFLSVPVFYLMLILIQPKLHIFEKSEVLPIREKPSKFNFTDDEKEKADAEAALLKSERIDQYKN